MKILVTGGTGLLGAMVGEKLLENGHEPVLYDIAPRLEQIERIKDDVEVVRGDIQVFPELLKTLREKKVEAIIHTASVLTRGALERPYAAIKINVDGTANILEAVRIEGIQKISFCSSATVYDFGVLRDRPVTESHPVLPKSVYASTKLACEYLGNNYSDLYGIKFISLRFCLIYGPGYSQSGFASLWLHPLLSAMVAGKSYRMQRLSRRVNEYIYAPDAASALVSALQSETESTVFNIGEGKFRSFNDIINEIQNLFPEQRIEITESTGKDSQYTEMAFPYDISLAKKELGFKTEFPLEKALPHYIHWLKEHI